MHVYVNLSPIFAFFVAGSFRKANKFILSSFVVFCFYYIAISFALSLICFWAHFVNNLRNNNNNNNCVAYLIFT